MNLGNGITLTGVLYVPDMKINLFSVAKALRRHYEITFSPAGCTIRRNGRDIMAATRSGNLFCIENRPALENLVHGNVPTSNSTPPAITPPESQAITRTPVAAENNEIHSQTL